ncbi:MAG: thiol-disulfide oxidoreductase [SAR86 cluster bacterium]|uniref:Thiol-disulfide oxidoreductase n=1 Tax=SAR86 cluster bacterium TaxID=2030880 RepID=A0A2A4MK61_9GAMM|nr:MAG: thiol-disulfide oxidoreductase [SAR86 cluster bacterium]
MNLPPNIEENEKVILFDGVCKLCNSWCNFIIKNDKNYRVKLCSVQSEQGQKILKYFDFPTEVFESMLYVEGNSVYQKSDAFFKIMALLGRPWSLLSIFKIIPKPIRDFLYDRIALNRYSLFGKYDVCQLPNADHEHRYLREK